MGLIWHPELNKNSFCFVFFFLSYNTQFGHQLALFCQIFAILIFILTYLISLQTENQTWTSDKCTNREWAMKNVQRWTFLIFESRFGDNTFPSHAAKMYMYQSSGPILLALILLSESLVFSSCSPPISLYLWCIRVPAIFRCVLCSFSFVCLFIRLWGF